MPPKKAAAATEKKTKSSSSGGKKGKGPSAYNIYMKKKLAEFKEKYPDMAHKDRFKKVAEEWKNDAENPNKK